MLDVKKWLVWAIRQFGLTDIKVKDWNMTGLELCEMSHKEFQRKVSNDPKNIFWTHLELLRKCKFVGWYKTLFFMTDFNNNKNVLFIW